MAPIMAALSRMSGCSRPRCREQDAQENRRDSHGMESTKRLAQEKDREHGTDGRKQMEREAGGVGADDRDAAIPEGEAQHRRCKPEVKQPEGLGLRRQARR